MQRRGPNQSPPLRQSQPRPPTEPPLHSHSPFPSAASYPDPSAHLSRSDKSAERHTRPAHIDSTRPSTAAYVTQQPTSVQPAPPSLSPPQPQSSRSSSRSSQTSSRVSKQFDAASRGIVFCLTSPTSFIVLPTRPKPTSPSLLQPFLVLQLALPPLSSPSASSTFSLHISLLSSSHIVHSLVLSSAISSITLHPFGADLPLSLPSGAWLNVCIPVRDLLWDLLQVQYGGVDNVTLRGQCKVRRVFGVRHAVNTTGGGLMLGEDEDEYDSGEVRLRYERRENVPVDHDFDPDVLHRTLIYSQHVYPTNRRLAEQSRRRLESLDAGRAERVEESRRRVSRPARTTVPYTRSRATAADTPHQWEESIEVAGESASAAPVSVQRNAALKSIARSKRSTQPLPVRSLAPQSTDSEKRPSFHVPTSYQIVPYTNSSNLASAASHLLPTSPPNSRQLQRERRNERRRTAEDKPHHQQRRNETVHDSEANTDRVFHSASSRPTAGMPFSPSSSNLPSRPPGPLVHAATSELRPRSPLQVRRPPTLIRTYTAPETIDVQHNVVGRERRDTRGEERREEPADADEVAMERAGTAGVYRTSPVVKEHDKRLEQRQHRRSRRKREDRRGRDKDELQQPQPSHGIDSHTARDRTSSSVAVSHSYAFRPDISSAESTPNSTSAASSHAASRRASLSSSSVSASPLPASSHSDMSSNTVSLSSTPFSSFPSSPTIRSARPSLIAHAVTSNHSAPSSRRQSVQSAREGDSGRLPREEEQFGTNGRERQSQRRSSSTSRPNTVPLQRVAEVDTGRPERPSISSPRHVTPALPSTFPSSILSTLSYAPVTASTAPDEPAAATSDSRVVIASLFSSPSASVTSWPVVSAGPSSPPPYSTLPTSLKPFSFISKLSDTASSAPAAQSSSTLMFSSALSASLPVSSTTSPSPALRPLTSSSQPVSPSPAASTDWARMTITEDARKTRDKTLTSAGVAGGDRAQERVLEEIEEEVIDEELEGEQAEDDGVEPAGDDEDEASREVSALLLEPTSGKLDTSLHSDRSHQSSSGVSDHSHTNSSPTSARVMAVSQHLRRLRMPDSSYDERVDDPQHAEDGKYDEDEVEQDEQSKLAADVPHFIHRLPASSTDMSSGSASFAAPVRSAPLLSMPFTSLVPMSSTSPERPPHSASPAPTDSSAPPSPSLLAAPSFAASHTSRPAALAVTQPRSPSPPSRPASTGDLLVRYDPVLRAYFCPGNGCWYELKADVE